MKVMSILAGGRMVAAKARAAAPPITPGPAAPDAATAAVSALRAEFEDRIAAAYDRVDAAEAALEAAATELQATRTQANSAMERLVAVSDRSARTLEELQNTQARLSGIEEQMAAEYARRDRMHTEAMQAIANVKTRGSATLTAPPARAAVEPPTYEMVVAEYGLNGRAARVVLRPMKAGG